MSTWNVKATHPGRMAETSFTVEADDKATAADYAQHRAPGFDITDIQPG